MWLGEMVWMKSGWEGISSCWMGVGGVDVGREKVAEEKN